LLPLVEQKKNFTHVLLLTSAKKSREGNTAICAIQAAQRASMAQGEVQGARDAA
jgi:hypothetical protein